LWGNESTCLEEGSNGYLKHSDILPIEMT